MGEALQAVGREARWPTQTQGPGRRDLLLFSNHSITSSARPSSVSGKVRPSALAVLRLITSSTFVSSWTYFADPGLRSDSATASIITFRLELLHQLKPAERSIAFLVAF